MSTQKEGDNVARITPEIAKEEMEKLFAQFGTIGPGSQRDGAAQMVIQSLEVLSRRVDKPEILKILYVNNPEVSKMLPELALKTVKELSEGRITSEQAKESLVSAIPEYIEAFKELGITPQPSWGIYFKGN